MALPPNRMTAYQNARAAEGPQRGLTYSELLLDNILGLDNEYLSAGEQLGQAINADELGFLKNAAVGAYEGAKRVVSDPIGAGEDLLYGIYDSVSNLATEDLDARLRRMYGVGFDQASDDQINKARESVFADALTASQLIPGAAVAKRGLGAISAGRGVERMAGAAVPGALVPEALDIDFTPVVPDPLDEPNMWEGVEPDAGFIDVGDIDWDEDVVDQMNNAMLRREGLLPPEDRFEVRPTTVRQEGIAGLYSPTRKAVDLLDRSEYDNLDSLRVQLLNRGAKPDEVERVISRTLDEFDEDPITKDRLAQIVDEVGQDVVVSTRTLATSPRDNYMTLTDDYFLKGAEDIGANVFEIRTDDAPVTAFAHFKPSGDTTAPLMHTRFGMLRSPGADKPDTYHLGEIQSDWAQMRQKLFTSKEELDKAREKYLAVDNEVMDLVNQRNDLSDGDPRREALTERITNLRNGVDSLYDKIYATSNYGFRGDFDAKYPAPYVGTTSKWVQLGLRQSLADAVNRGAKRMTLSTGQQVAGYTFGKKSGQSKFYDEIVPKELDEVLRKFAKEAGIRKPEITMSTVEGAQGQKYSVPTVEFTDEFVDAIKRLGLPAYAKGGIVKGSYLDVDIFEPSIR